MAFRLLQIADVRWWNAGAHYAVALSGALARAGHEVMVAGLPESPALVRSAAMGLRTAGIPGLDGAWAGGFPAAAAALGRLIARERFDLVNAHRGGGHLAAALALRGRARAALVRTRGDIRAPRVHAMSRLLYRRWTDRIILSGDFMRRDYDAFHLPPGKLVTVRGGVDLSEFRPAGDQAAARRALGLPVEAPMAGVVARLSPVKGHADFLEAAAEVRRAVPLARFVVAGAEYQVKWRELEERARSLGIHDAVSYLGEVADVRPVMAALDLAVVASRGSEAICRVAMEHLACGVPVVATGAGVLPEIVEDGVNGFRVPAADPRALAEAMTRVLADPELRARLAAGARRSAEERFDLSAFARATEAVYREAIDG